MANPDRITPNSAYVVAKRVKDEHGKTSYEVHPIGNDSDVKTLTLMEGNFPKRQTLDEVLAAPGSIILAESVYARKNTLVSRWVVPAKKSGQKAEVMQDKVSVKLNIMPFDKDKINAFVAAINDPANNRKSVMEVAKELTIEDYTVSVSFLDTQSAHVTQRDALLGADKEKMIVFENGNFANLLHLYKNIAPDRLEKLPEEVVVVDIKRTHNLGKSALGEMWCGDAARLIGRRGNHDSIIAATAVILQGEKQDLDTGNTIQFAVISKILDEGKRYRFDPKMDAYLKGLEPEVRAVINSGGAVVSNKPEVTRLVKAVLNKKVTGDAKIGMAIKDAANYQAFEVVPYPHNYSRSVYSLATANATMANEQNVETSEATAEAIIPETTAAAAPEAISQDEGVTPDDDEQLYEDHESHRTQSSSPGM